MKKNNLTFVEAALAYVYKQRGGAYGLMVLFLAVGASAFTQKDSKIAKETNSTTITVYPQPNNKWSETAVESCAGGVKLCAIEFDTQMYGPISPEGYLPNAVESKLPEDPEDYEGLDHGEPLPGTDIRIFLKE